MKPHLQYLWYVLRHKWWVFVAGLKVGVPLYRLIIHDWSKLGKAEWGPYVRKFYGDGNNKEEFDAAVQHHYDHNKHHHAHWEGNFLTFDMPETYIREMIADWMGAGRAQTGKWEFKEWYERKGPSMKMSPKTRERVDELMATL